MGRVIFLLVAAIAGFAAVIALPPCTTIASTLLPCLPHVTNMPGATAPAPACCTGVQKILDMGETKADRQGICECLKGQAAAISNLNSTRVTEFPKACKVNVPIPLGPNIDCNQIE